MTIMGKILDSWVYYGQDFRQFGWLTDDLTVAIMGKILDSLVN